MLLSFKIIKMQYDNHKIIISYNVKIALHYIKQMKQIIIMKLIAIYINLTNAAVKKKYSFHVFHVYFHFYTICFRITHKEKESFIVKYDNITML